MKSGETRSQVKSGETKCGSDLSAVSQISDHEIRWPSCSKSGEIRGAPIQTVWSTHQQSCATKYWCLLPPGTQLLSLASIISTSFFFSLFASSSSDRWQMLESNAMTGVTFRFSDGCEYIVGGGVKVCSLELLKIRRILAIPDSWSHATSWSEVFMI